MSIPQAWCRAVYWTCLIAMTWWQMQVVHEAGHISAALLLGEQIAEINLHPLQLSHTLLVSHDYSLTFLWAGPLCGVLIPIVIWQFARLYKPEWSHVLRFLTGFCLIANGAYLGSAGLSAVGDAKDLLQQQVPITWLLSFAAITIPTGFCLWNGQGAKFGLGKNAKDVTRRQAVQWLLTTTVWFIAASCLFPLEFVE